MAKLALYVFKQVRPCRPALLKPCSLPSNSYSTTPPPPPRPKRKQLSLPASYYRGGTSRALFFHRRDLPSSPSFWDPIFLSVLGSPDPNGRQLDGLGGGISSLSKICICSPSPPSSHASVDIDFTFAAIGIKDRTVDYSANCGNMLAAVGPWGVDMGVVKLSEEEERRWWKEVGIWNTNSGKVIRSRFEVVGGEAVAEGIYGIDGVSGSGAKIELSFLDPAGSKTGKMLPTGARVDIFDLGNGTKVRGTCIDVGNPCVFVKAKDLGVDGAMLPEQMERNPRLLGMLESIRAQAAVEMGLSELGQKPPESIPKIAMVSRPSTHRLLSGDEIAGGDVDVAARAMSVGQPHRAVPVTVAMALAAAADLDGSVVAEMVKGRVGEGSLTIGHPSGKTLMGCEWDGKRLVSCKVFRTARRLMEGRVFWKDERDD